MSKTGNNANLMTAPAQASRVPIFCPSLKAGRTEWEGETPWGTASVRGRLTQTHRNVLDSIFAFAIDFDEMDNGAMEVLVDPYTIAKVTGSSRDYEWLASKRKDSILSDLRHADVNVTLKDGTWYSGGIVSEWRESTRMVDLPGGALKGKRPLLAVTISAAWMQLYKKTLSVGYRDLLPAIAALPSGAQQALVRFCITHQQLNMKLDEAMQHIGAVTQTTSPRRRREVLKDVRDADLRAFGISIDDDTVYYSQHSSVRCRSE